MSADSPFVLPKDLEERVRRVQEELELDRMFGTMSRSNLTHRERPSMPHTSFGRSLWSTSPDPWAELAGLTSPLARRK